MDKELLEAGYRAYTGEKIDIYFNTDVCQHNAFQPETKTVDRPGCSGYGHGD